MADAIPSSGSGHTSVDSAGAKRGKRLLVFGIVVVVAAVGGGAYWLLNHNLEATDDSFIESDVVTLSPRIGGRVLAVDFTDNQIVKQGQVLVEIDPADYQAALLQAQAALAIAQAQAQAADADLAVTRLSSQAQIDGATHAVEQAQQQVAAQQQQADAASADAVRAGADVTRSEALLKSSDASRQQYDLAVATARGNTARARAAASAATAAQAAAAQAQSSLDDAKAAPQRIALKEAQLAVANAQVDQARATLAVAQLNLSYTRITAPAAGRLGKRAVEPGEVVQSGAAFTNLVVDPPWVVANFKETQMARMRIGQPVSITIDALPGRTLSGRVDSFQPASGARFSLLPPENATGNFVKVVQRVPVKITFANLPDDLAHALSPGMSVEPEVDVGAAGSSP